MRPARRLPRGIKEIAEPEPLRILALSGGGYRGLFAADVLARLDRLIGSPMADRFDLFAGTSVGGIIAAGMALGRPPQQLRDAMVKHGPSIFDDRVRIGSTTLFHKPSGHLGGLVRSKFNAEALEEAIDDILGSDRDLKVGDLERNLVLVATCATTKSLFLMSSLRPDSPGGRLPLRGALRATSAAPGYFPAVDLELRSLVDGGLVANAPDLVAAAELLELRHADPADLRIMSIGTAAPDGGAVPQPVGRRGLAKWITGDLVSLTLDAQEKLVTSQAAAIFGSNYLRINASPPNAQGQVLALDLATTEATRTLLHLSEEAVSKLSLARVKQILGLR